MLDVLGLVHGEFSPQYLMRPWFKVTQLQVTLRRDVSYEGFKGTKIQLEILMSTPITKDLRVTNHRGLQLILHKSYH